MVSLSPSATEPGPALCLLTPRLECVLHRETSKEGQLWAMLSVGGSADKTPSETLAVQTSSEFQFSTSENQVPL